MSVHVVPLICQNSCFRCVVVVYVDSFRFRSTVLSITLLILTVTAFAGLWPGTHVPQPECTVVTRIVQADLFPRGATFTYRIVWKYSLIFRRHTKNCRKALSQTDRTILPCRFFCFRPCVGVFCFSTKIGQDFGVDTAVVIILFNTGFERVSHPGAISCGSRLLYLFWSEIYR